jgi:hypothetical protein
MIGAQELQILKELTDALQANTNALLMISSRVPSDKELWSAKQCAAYLGKSSHRSFLEYVASRPGFPSAIPIPSTRSEIRSSRMWLAKEVQDWAISNRPGDNSKRQPKK